MGNDGHQKSDIAYLSSIITILFINLSSTACSSQFWLTLLSGYYVCARLLLWLTCAPQRTYTIDALTVWIFFYGFIFLFFVYLHPLWKSWNGILSIHWQHSRISKVIISSHYSLKETAYQKFISKTTYITISLLFDIPLQGASVTMLNWHKYHYLKTLLNQWTLIQALDIFRKSKKGTNQDYLNPMDF